MSAKYTRKDKVRTAITALIVGCMVGAAYKLPPLVTIAALCIALYWIGVMDGRATRRGGRIVEVTKNARADVVTRFQRLVKS